MDNSNLEIQRALYEMLVDVVKLLKRNNIPYFMIEGSCLGVIRHGGFIPWDDDIDIAVPAEYYEILKEMFHKQLADKYLFVGAFEQKDYPDNTDCLTRIYNQEVTVQVDLYLETKVMHPCIDIMLIYGMPNGNLKQYIHFSKVLMRKMFLKLSNRKSIGFDNEKKRGMLEKLLLKVVKKVDTSIIFNENKQAKKIKDLLMKYSYSQSEKVFVFPSDYRRREVMPKEIYAEGEMKTFDNLEVQVPKQWDRYLKQLYNDYMELPPLEQRCGKHKMKIIHSRSVE